MIKLNEEEVVLVTKIAKVKKIRELDELVKCNTDELSTLLNTWSNRQDIKDISLESTEVDSSLDRIWGFINNLSERAGEFLEFETEAYDLCRRIVIINK